MDNSSPPPVSAAKRWAWIAEKMPGVARLIADKRRELGNEWVNECWKRGVIQREPGWFYAGEGGIMIGTLWDDAQVIAFSMGKLPLTSACVILAPKPEGWTP